MVQFNTLESGRRQPAAPWVKKVGGAGICNFPTDSCKFLAAQIVGAQISIFAPKFP